MGAVVDGGVGPEGLAQRAFFVGRGGSNHFGAHGLGNLDSRSAYAAGCAQNQNRLALFEHCAIDQGMPGSRINHDERCGIHCGEAFGQRHAQGRWCQGVGTETSRSGEASHALPGREVRHTRSHRLYHAGIFRTRYKWQCRLHLVFVLNNQEVGKIEARGFNLDQYFARTRCRSRKFGPFQCFDAGGFSA